MIFIYRQFALYNDNGSVRAGCGDITLKITENNFIEIDIGGLHDGGEGVQALMCVKYAPNLDIYDVVCKILDKISYDLHYRENKKEPYHRDFIINAAKIIKNRELWNNDTTIRQTNGGKVWLPFTRENAAKHVEIQKCDKTFHKTIRDLFVIRGEVDENCEFTYDYPIIEASNTIEVYNKTRGNMDYKTDFYNWRYAAAALPTQK